MYLECDFCNTPLDLSNPSKEHVCDVLKLQAKVKRLEERLHTNEQDLDQIRYQVLRLLQDYNKELYSRNEDINVKAKFLRDLSFACKQFPDGEKLDYLIDDHYNLSHIVFEISSLFKNHFNLEKRLETLNDLRESLIYYYKKKKYIDENGHTLMQDGKPSNRYHLSVEELLRELKK